MDYDIFISYSRADSEVASRIYEALTNAGFSVFFDRTSITSEEFPLAIANGILNAKIVLFLASQNSVTARYAAREIVFANEKKARNALIVYKIAPCNFPPDIELLLSSLNQRDSAYDSIAVLIDDCSQLLAEGEISNLPKVSKSQESDPDFINLLDHFQNQDYFGVISAEIKTGNWRENWNHHLLLMKAYVMVGDRGNYTILLNQYLSSHILYFPSFYTIVGQVWDMIKMGFYEETEALYSFASKIEITPEESLCLKVNYNHILALEGKIQAAINNFRDLMNNLNRQERKKLIGKDFDTLRWIGNYDLINVKLEAISNYLGFVPQKIYTDRVSKSSLSGYIEILEGHPWHCTEGDYTITLAYKAINGVGNIIYYITKNLNPYSHGIFGLLPWNNESPRIITSKIHCQYRLAAVNQHLIIEEFNPLSEEISVGEILNIDKKHLKVKIIYNGNEKDKGRIRKYKNL